MPLPGMAGSPLKIPLRRRMARAAVAIIHRDRPGDAGQQELLFMQRAQRAGDPWSGDMSFPGGLMHVDDPTPRAAAERETFEETGLDLTRYGSFEQRLSDRLTRQHHRWRPMVITPYVYAWHGNDDVVLNHEVQSLVWIPLAHLAAPEQQSVMHWRSPLGRVRLPCCRYQGHCIWGLSYSMLREYLKKGGYQPGDTDRRV